MHGRTKTKKNLHISFWARKVNILNTHFGGGGGGGGKNLEVSQQVFFFPNQIPIGELVNLCHPPRAFQIGRNIGGPRYIRHLKACFHLVSLLVLDIPTQIWGGPKAAPVEYNIICHTYRVLETVRLHKQKHYKILFKVLCCIRCNFSIYCIVYSIWKCCICLMCSTCFNSVPRHFRIYFVVRNTARIKR